MNDHRHIIVEGEELYHWGVKGMKWKNHVYAATNKVGTTAKKVASAASKFAKKANEMKERLTPAAKVAKGKAKAALKRRAKSISDDIKETQAYKKTKNKITQTKRKVNTIREKLKTKDGRQQLKSEYEFESMKRRTSAARKPTKEPGMARKRKIADARRDADLQVARENYVDAKSKRGRNNPFVYDSRLDKPARQIDKATAISGTKNANRTKQALSKLEDYENARWYKNKAAFTSRTRSQKVGKKKTNGR